MARESKFEYDTERYLVSKIIQTGDFQFVADAGIKRDHFLNPDSNAAFRFISKFKEEYGRVPSHERFAKNGPYKILDAESEPWEDLIKEVRTNHALAILDAAAAQSIDFSDARDPEGIMRVFQDAFSQISIDNPSLRDVDITKTTDDRIQRYLDRQQNDTTTMLGIPSGFEIIDDATLGFQKQQLITLVGPPKAGKSTSLLLMAKKAHDMGCKVLFIGFEMNNTEQVERYDSIISQVNHSKMRTGSIDGHEFRKIQRTLEEFGESENFFILSSDPLSMTTLSGIAAKVDQYKPDLLIVDGVYMMQDEFGNEPNSPKALTNITRGFKRLAQNKEIPVIITTQVLEWKMDKKRGVTSNSIGYSSSFTQDSDTVLAVENTEDDDIKKIKIVLSRNSGYRETYVIWDWEKSQFAEQPEGFIPGSGEEDEDDDESEEDGNSRRF